MQNHEEPDAEPGAACRTPFCKKIGGTADFEVNFLAPEEETDGLFLSYTVVQGTPSVCDALAKSRNEFSQAPQSHKVVLRRLPLKQEPKLNLQYHKCRVIKNKYLIRCLQTSSLEILLLIWSKYIEIPYQVSRVSFEHSNQDNPLSGD